MSIFKRVSKILKSQANSFVDGLEDPIKLSEQGIRDLKTDLEQSIKALAELKATLILSKRKAKKISKRLEEYQQKAMFLLHKAKKNEIPAEKADELASFALSEKNKEMINLENQNENSRNLAESIAKLEAQINELKRVIKKWENELETLKAKSVLSKTSKNINQQMALIDYSGTIALLEKMKGKVEKEEILADIYGDFAKETKEENEINKILTKNNTKIKEELKALKERMKTSEE